VEEPRQRPVDQIRSVNFAPQAMARCSISQNEREVPVSGIDDQDCIAQAIEGGIRE
jgi:hypothetical protein